LAHFSDSPGSIYPALRRLERRGLVTATSGSKTLRPKQVYHLTNAGRAELRHWVGLAVTRAEVIGRDGVMLRFVFVEQMLGTAATLSFLRELERVLEAYIPELQAYYDTSAVAMPPGARLALKGGIDQYRSQLLWARDGIDQFARLASDETA
jgi:DNA-binding PadR family transcriptional regulator